MSDLGAPAEQSRKAARFKLPQLSYLALRLIQASPRSFVALARLESLLLRRRVDTIPIDRPIYICGVPRCGTTITLEMLSEHPSVATHRYADLLMPYLPFAWTWIAERLLRRIADPPQERIHQDGLKVTHLSPDAGEEMLWLAHFADLHSEATSCVLRAEDANPAFDRFYTDTVKKLLLARRRDRYLSKGNYNATRLLYLHRLFPDARFLVMIRDPVHQIASLMKTDRLFNALAEDDPWVGSIMAATGHFEFGPGKRWSRVGASAEPIGTMYRKGEQAAAWALHWSAVYQLLQAQLREHPTLAARTLVVRYEDLCRAPSETIDRIILHCQLDPAPFAATREGYARKLAEPTYYRPDFSAEELAQIARFTDGTRQAFGYAASSSEGSARCGASGRTQ